MKILYIAYSCDPYNGSEDKIGWNVPVAYVQNNPNDSVYVITKKEQKNAVEKYLAEKPMNNIRFYFVDIPAIYKMIFRGFLYSGRLNIWNRKVLPLAKRICKENGIQIIHQITPIEFRAIGDYGKIKGTKFVVGPLGGGESMPSGLKSYTKGHEIIEYVRYMINRWYRFKFRLTRKLDFCDYIMFANKETMEFLSECVGGGVTCSHEIFFDNGLSVEEFCCKKCL